MISNRLPRGSSQRAPPRTSSPGTTGVFRVSKPFARRSRTPSASPSSAIGSPSNSSCSSGGSPQFNFHSLFNFKVKGSTFSQLPKELDLWRKTLNFLDEYLDLLVFFNASGCLRGNADKIEKSFHQYRVTTAKRIVQALINLRDEVVEFPPSQEAVTELERAYECWDILDNSLFVVIWEFNKGLGNP